MKEEDTVFGVLHLDPDVTLPRNERLSRVTQMGFPQPGDGKADRYAVK